ncbi:MAG: hypothetical protein JWN79_2491, partial [Gemmatimonadetes bacterium]|nr:hypothetical protein [Gemmatimonadota bacterium]
MNERRRPPRRGRGTRPSNRSAAEQAGEDNPYRDAPGEGMSGESTTATESAQGAPERTSPPEAPAPSGGLEAQPPAAAPLARPDGAPGGN